jgi:hypothetical protein
VLAPTTESISVQPAGGADCARAVLAKPETSATQARSLPAVPETEGARMVPGVGAKKEADESYQQYIDRHSGKRSPD